MLSIWSYPKICCLVKNIILLVRSDGRGLGNLFTAVANHVTPSQRDILMNISTELCTTQQLVHGCGESCQVSKSPAT